MKVGIHLPQYGRTAGADSVRRAAQAAEALGYSDVWVSDHVIHPAAQDYPSPFLFDPFVTLTWAAAVTSTIGLGTSVVVAPQYHPLWLANTTASLDAMSGVNNTCAGSMAVFAFSSEQQYVDLTGPDPIQVNHEYDRYFPLQQVVDDYGHVDLDVSSSPTADTRFLHVLDYLGTLDYWNKPW